MRHLFFSLMISYVFHAHAEDTCKFVMDIQMTSLKILGEPTDVQELLTPSENTLICRTFYRINIDDTWRSATGYSTGRTREEACSKALSIGNGKLLSEIPPDKVRSITETLCTDFEDIQIRPVKIGDRIWESNVDIPSNRKDRNYFSYKGTRCRMFSEQIPVLQGLYLARGVICRIGTTPNARWLVIDKY